MTNEEAIKILQGVIKKPNTKDGYLGQALDMAIKALEQEPCNDAISRQAVIVQLSHNKTGDDDCDVIIQKDIETIKALPSVTPQSKVGEWLEKEIHSDKVGMWQSARCSVCDKYHTTPYMYYFSHYDYCPHCGSKMEGRQKLDKGRSKRNR